MNFESGFTGDSLEADQPRLRQRRHLIWIVSGGLLAVIVAIFLFTLAFLSFCFLQDAKGFRKGPGKGRLSYLQRFRIFI